MPTANIDLKPLHNTIRNRGLMESWADGLFVESEEEGKKRAEAKAEEAEQNYIRMMQSPKNDDSVSYQTWAIAKALGIQAPKTGHGNTGSSRRGNKGLG